MRNRVKNIHLDAWLQRVVGTPSKKSVNKADEGWVNVARAFHCEREEDTIGIYMMFRIVSMLSIASNLGSLRMNCFVRLARRREDKVAKERAEGRIEKGDENVGALTRGNERRANIEGSSAFMNDRSSGLEWIPMMNISRGFRDFI